MRIDMENNTYVLNHNYGYGKTNEPKQLNKILLRNENDLWVYINNAIKKAFREEFKNNQLTTNNQIFLIKITT